MTIDNCIFCQIDDKEINNIFIRNELFYARWDNFPISKGHAEIIPIKHIESFFDLNKNELFSMYDLMDKAKDLINTKYSPDAYNIGINDGTAAGRTVHHLHIHLIPRYNGDVENPRGGVRHIIPGKGFY